jgi:hypothetical protein
MPSPAQSHHNTVAPLHYAISDYSFVAPSANRKEIQFIANRVLYNAQADIEFVFEPIEEPVKNAGSESHSQAQSIEQTIVLDQWALSKAFQERDAVLAQLPGLRDHYADISQYHIDLAAVLVVYALGRELKPQSFASYLTYNQSLQVRADLPNGTVYVSVIFEPGINPTLAIPDEDGDDANTIISFYDVHGALKGGTNGPLRSVLMQVAALFQQSALVA